MLFTIELNSLIGSKMFCKKIFHDTVTYFTTILVPFMLLPRTSNLQSTAELFILKTAHTNATESCQIVLLKTYNIRQHFSLQFMFKDLAAAVCNCNSILDKAL